MSKITFRADDDLIRQLEEFDASKSEVMREALRTYLAESDVTGVNVSKSVSTGENVSSDTAESLDELIEARVDALIADRLDTVFTPTQPQDVNVNISLDGDSASVSHGKAAERKTPVDDSENTSDTGEQACKQCGENLAPDAVYCSNCGEKASHRVFCECGDELRSDWGFCPGCGRRTPAADVLRDS